MRKNKKIWSAWSHKQANGLHSLQLMILERGIELLKVGGRIVYSTCSFNPIENEAVVAEMLNLAGESVRLVDVSAEMPELKRRCGLSNWSVRGRDEKTYASFDDMPAEASEKIAKSMFPPANAAGLHLERWYVGFKFESI